MGREEVVATGPLRLEWRDGPRAPFKTSRESVAVNGGIVYCRDGDSDYKILMFNSETGQWTVLQSCPKKYFSHSSSEWTIDSNWRGTFRHSHKDTPQPPHSTN